MRKFLTAGGGRVAQSPRSLFLRLFIAVSCARRTDFEQAIPVTLIEALGLMAKRVQDEKTISAPGMKMDNT